MVSVSTKWTELDSGTHRESSVVEDLVDGATEEVGDAVILEDGVDWTLDVSPVPQRLRVAAVDAVTTAVPPVLATYRDTQAGALISHLISSHLF